MREGPLKAGLFRLLGGSGAIAVAQSLARGVPILAYHGVTANDAPAANLRRLHVPVALFEQHLQLLAARFRPLALGELLALLESGRALPRRAVVLSFDDGYRNFATQAWPLLKRHGVPATLFVVGDGGQLRFWQDRVESALLAARSPALDWRGTRISLATDGQRAAAAAQVVASLEGPQPPAPAALAELFGQTGECDEPDEDRDRLGWSDLRQLQADGLRVGSHADRHEPLTSRTDDVKAALAASHDALRRELGPGDYALSYPFGARSAAIRGAVREAGFRCGLSGRPALACSGTDLFDMPRLLLGADDDLLRVRLSLSGLRAFWQPDPWPGGPQERSA